MAWKYVILQVANRELPIIFPDRLVHAMVADAIKNLLVEEAKFVAAPHQLDDAKLVELRAGIKVVAAGEVNIDVYWAGGGSETLGVGSRVCDASAMNLMPYTFGIVPEEEGTDAD